LLYIVYDDTPARAFLDVNGVESILLDWVNL